MEISERLSEIFSADVEKRDSILSVYPVGIEIEVKFSSYFPQLYNKYLSHQKTYSIEEQSEIDKEIGDTERPLLDKLEKTISAGIPRGKDRYWEFSIQPQKDQTEQKYQI